MILYSIVISFLRLGYRLASISNSKARAFISGRKNIFQTLKMDMNRNTHPVVWIHCASVGEFEQGRPVMEAFRKEFHRCKILLTFFSPSGYELRKNYDGADWIYYLPWDTKVNAKKWVDTVKPAMVIFVKYEFWLNYTTEIHKRNIPLISISSTFRPSQVFFQRYGIMFRMILKNFTHFFVQNTESVRLLKLAGIENTTVAGDTRFDRVYQITQNAEEIPVAQVFKSNEKVMVAGSCWPEDMEVLAPLINEGKLKFIIAPHEIAPEFLNDIERSLEVKSIRYSQAVVTPNPEEYSVLLIDNMGLLSRLYRYGEFAFVGGAFGKGLHNILEAACYGVPIFFGNKNYQKFNEAQDLIMRGGAFEISDFADLKAKYEMLNEPENFLLACEVTRSYVEENIGATEKILKYCRTILKV